MNITLRMTLPLVAMLAAFTPLAARASVNFDHSGYSLPGTFADVDHRGEEPFSITAPGSIDKLIELTDFEMPTLPTVAVAELPQPSVETPLHKLFCVEYARARSGLAVFGDAKFWWSRAKNSVRPRHRAGRKCRDGVLRLHAAQERPCRGGDQHHLQARDPGGPGQLAESW